MAKPVNTQALEKRSVANEKKINTLEIAYEKNTETLFDAHNLLEEKVLSISDKLDLEIKKTRILIASNLGLFSALLYLNLF